jgi:restriction system protein
MYEEHKKAAAAQARERERSVKEYLRNQEQIVRETAAEQASAARAAEQERQAATREAEQLAKARERDRKVAAAVAEKAERDRVRAAVAVERERLARERELAKSAVEQQHASARARTETVAAMVAGFGEVLLSRAVELRGRAQEVGRSFDRGGPAAFCVALDGAVARSRYPEGVVVGVSTRFFPESREVVVDCELPRQDVVPRAVAYRYRVREKDVRAEPRKEGDVRRIYRELVARVALRVVAEVFDAAPAPLVDSVVFNGSVSARDRATGQPVRPCVVSLVATRDAVEGLVLDEPELDPVLCLGHLHAIVSPHPYDLEPVKPVTYFDPTRYKLIDEVGSVAGLDHRLDLLSLSAVEFEYLIQRLFEAVGMKSWVRNTRASKDEGVDAVAVNEDPLVGGVCVIQAKRWKDVVGLESVHALAGVMGDKQATRGILVATSWFGKASIDFVNRHGRMQLIDGRNLKAMLTEHLQLDVLISLPKLPRGWDRHDIT